MSAISVVVGCADQGLAYELRSQLSEVGDVEIAYVAASTAELTSAVLRFEPDVIVLHDRLGPEDVVDVMRDLSLRRPGSAHLVITSDTEPETYAAAMAAGARGLLSYPFAFEEIQSRVADAVEWARTMQRLVKNQADLDPEETGRAIVVGITGAKGGVGTTTVALHLALDAVRQSPGKVLLLDLDLEKGDVGALLEARHRVSVADLAKVSDDLGPRTVMDAVLPHDTGVHLLLTPLDVRDVEHVTPQAIRRIVSLLRQQYDVVVVDVGSHVTPVQAALVEIADEVVIVTTPDVLSLRALRRSVQSWETLGVRKASAVRVLLNQTSKQDAVQPDTVRQLAQVPAVSVALPAMFRKLEQAVNSRDPLQVRDQTWWRAVRAVSREIGLVSAPQRQGLAARQIQESVTPTRKRRFGGREPARPAAVPVAADSERGSITLETVGILPAILLVVALIWQVLLVGATVVWTGHAASAAAQAVAVGDDPGPPARDRLPAAFRSDAEVVRTGNDVRVSVEVPLFAPGLLSGPWNIVVDRQVVVEP